MSKPTGRVFVGRVDPLNEFYRRFSYRRMKNGIYYWGGGGVGKTWLLQKIYDDALQDPTRTVPAIIDLFDTCNHSVRGLQATIRDRLSCSEVFHPYDDLIARIEQARASSTTTQFGAIASLEARANRQFINCCQRAISLREVVLLFDTFERVHQRVAGHWLVREFLPQVDTAIIAIAGRPISTSFPPSPARMPDNFVVYELPGFSEEEAREYIKRRAPDLDNAAVHTIWEHTGGAPLAINLILDLSARTARHDLIGRLNALEPETRIQDVPDLEQRLVGQFAGPPNTRQSLIWAMAYFRRRFDLRILRYLLAHAGEDFFPPGDYVTVREMLRKSIYVKEYREEESHLLHDEIQRIIATHVLKGNNDEWNEMRDSLYHHVVDGYYPEAIAQAEPELRRQLRAEQMGYRLDVDPTHGVEQYRALRSEVDETRDYDFEELLWDEINAHLNSPDDPGRGISLQNGYKVCEERGDWLLSHSLFRKAEQHYEEMVSRYPAREIDSLQGLGFARVRLGEFKRARDAFNQSRAMIRDDDYAVIATIENNLGQEAQAAGRWNDALQHFARGLAAATMVDDQENMVVAYINRGYVYSLQGHYTAGRQQCRQALEILNRLPKNDRNARRLIWARMTVGTTYRHETKFHYAEQRYLKSLELAEREHHDEAAAEARQHLGINCHLVGRTMRRDLLGQTLPGKHLRDSQVTRQQKLADAAANQVRAFNYLTVALDMARKAGWQKAIADGLNRLAKVYRELDRLDRLLVANMPDIEPPEIMQDLQALASALRIPEEEEYQLDLLTDRRFEELSWFDRAVRLFDLSALAALDASYYHRALDSLTELARSFVEINSLDNVEKVLVRLERLLPQSDDYQEMLFAAVVKISRGDLAFRQHDLDGALDMYGEAYLALASELGYTRYFLVDRLRDLEWRLRELSSDMTLKWCNALETRWLAAPNIAGSLPDMLDTIERVRKEALARQKRSDVGGTQP